MHPALKTWKIISQIYQVTGAKHFGLPEYAIRFGLSFPEVSSVLVGIDKMDYLEQTLAAAYGAYLTKEELEKAKQLSYPDPDFLNLPYWDKMNWLK